MFYSLVCFCENHSRWRDVEALINSLRMNPPEELIVQSAENESEMISAKASDEKVTTEAKLDFDWLHEIGCGCDDTELPHHVSTAEEIETLMRNVERVLGVLPKPKLVTVARYVYVYLSYTNVQNNNANSTLVLYNTHGVRMPELPYSALSKIVIAKLIHCFAGRAKTTTARNLRWSQFRFRCWKC